MAAPLMNAMRVASRRSFAPLSSPALTRGGHHEVDSWIDDAQAPRSTLPFRNGPEYRRETQFKVYGYLGSALGVVVLAAVIAQSKA